MKINPKITSDLVSSACERSTTTLDNPGYCNACGAENDDVEPDAEGNECEICGEPAVYGVELLALMMF